MQSSWNKISDEQEFTQIIGVNKKVESKLFSVQLTQRPNLLNPD